MAASRGPRRQARRERTHAPVVRRHPRHHGEAATRGGAAAVARGDRAAEGPAPGGERLPQGGDQDHALPWRGHRPERRDPEDPANGGAGGSHGLLRSRARRDRQRQGARGPGHPPAEPAQGPPDGQGQLRGAAHRPRRERAVRPREGGLHRGPDAPDRALRGRRRLDPLPRRGRRAVARGAGQAAARAGDGRVRAAGEPPHDQGRRARRRGHEPRPRRGDQEGALPGGPLLPPQRLPDPGAAAARAGGGHPGARLDVPRGVLLPHGEEDHPGPAQDDGRAPALPLAGQRPRAAKRDRAQRHRHDRRHAAGADARRRRGGRGAAADAGRLRARRDRAGARGGALAHQGTDRRGRGAGSPALDALQPHEEAGHPAARAGGGRGSRSVVGTPRAAAAGRYGACGSISRPCSPALDGRGCRHEYSRA